MKDLTFFNWWPNVLQILSGSNFISLLDLLGLLGVCLRYVKATQISPGFPKARKDIKEGFKNRLTFQVPQGPFGLLALSSILRYAKGVKV